MSKKWKSKIKKQQKAKVIQESISSPTEIEKPAIMSSREKGKIERMSVENENLALLPEVARVKKDIKRIAMVAGTIIACIIIAAIADAKTGWVLKLSEILTKGLTH